MDIRQLRCFIAVADELHFGRAAELLALAPPALSRQIRTLESELGVALLIRTTRQVSLTRAGLVLLEEARAIIARTERAQVAVREADRLDEIVAPADVALNGVDAGLAVVVRADRHPLRRELGVQLGMIDDVAVVGPDHRAVRVEVRLGVDLRRLAERGPAQ